MSKHFEEELNELKGRLLHIGGLVESMIQLSIKALVDRNEAVSKEVFVKEYEVNKIQI